MGPAGGAGPRGAKQARPDDECGTRCAASAAEAAGPPAGPVILSEREIDFLLAHDYELSRKDADSIGRAVSQFLSDSALFTTSART